MLVVKTIFIFFINLVFLTSLFAQTGGEKTMYVTPTREGISYIPPSYKLGGISQYKCKLRYVIFIDTSALKKIESIKPRPKKVDIKKPEFLTVHGNVMYDYFYQSYLDTPYSGSSLQQHTISTFLDITVKDAYPLRMSFTTRLGNQNYLRDFSLLNLKFDRDAFARALKQKAQDWVSAQTNPDSLKLLNLRSAYDGKTEEYKSLKKWLLSPGVAQQLVAEKEHEIAKRNKQNKQLQENTAIDSISGSFAKKYNQQKARLDTIKNAVDSLWSAYSIEKRKWDSTKNALATAVSDLKNPKKWKQALDGIPARDSVLPKGYKTLLSISKFSVGTSVIDYSELSAKNITVKGLQLEYVPKYYYAVAGGLINYRFRDYLLPENSSSSQYLGLVRFGKGKPESSHLIFTYYFGRKNLYNYLVNDSSGNNVSPNSSLMGMTLEQRISITDNISVSAEVAKSSMPYYNRVNQSTKLLEGAFNFNDHSNEAYSIKANTSIPAINTKVDGYFKHYGENFQSFSSFSTNSRQNAWLIHVQQSLIKNQLTINALVRENDYVNPFLNQQYTSNIIFKSLQANLRIRKLPVISIGYYPTSQLIKLSENHYSENMFYNLVGSLNYYYRLFGLQMNSAALGSRFYNKPLDSGFVYYNSRNIYLDQTILMRKFTLNAGFTESFASEYNLSTINGGLQFKAKKWLTVGGTLKYTRQTLIETPLLGYSVNGSVIIPLIGNIQLRFQKSYVPGPSSTLVPDNIGRLTYYRNF